MRLTPRRRMKSASTRENGRTLSRFFIAAAGGVLLAASLEAAIWVVPETPAMRVTSDASENAWLSANPNFAALSAVGTGTSAATDADLPTVRLVSEAGFSPARTSLADRKLWIVTVPDLPKGEEVSWFGIPVEFVPLKTVVDSGGEVRIPLPNGAYDFQTTAAGRTIRWTAHVADADTTAILYDPTGVYVDGVDVIYLANEGWYYTEDTKVLTLTGPGPFMVSGCSTNISIAASADCAVTVSNLTLNLASHDGRSVFSIGDGAAVNLTLAGTNIMYAGQNGAAIRVTQGQAAIIAGAGSLEAVGGAHGAGIGGSALLPCGDITIAGGHITATGGGGYPGIGGRSLSVGGSVSISGGTVFLDDASTTIGNGRSSILQDCGTMFTGGAIYTTRNRVLPYPENGSGSWVYPVDFPIGRSLTEIEWATFSSSANYGDTDLMTDGDGNLRVWLPPTDSASYLATIHPRGGPTLYFGYGIDSNGNVTIRDSVLIVNGTAIIGGQSQSGSGWAYAASTSNVTFSSSGPFTISGNSPSGLFHLVATQDVAMVVSNLTLCSSAKSKSLLSLTAGDCALALEGTNLLAASGQYAAGIAVATNAMLTLSGTGAIEAQGGRNAAGIGSTGGFAPPGRIVIESGRISATGGDKAAGIGGGLSANLVASNILIRGGFVTAQGGASAAGIGAGYGRLAIPSDAVVVSDGTVLATKGAGTAANLGDLVASGNASAVTGYDTSLVIGGGSLIGTTGSVIPRPVDADGTQLYAVVLTNLTPFAAVAFEPIGLPAGYGTDAIYADGEGRASLWLPPTTDGCAYRANGSYYWAEGGGKDIVATQLGDELPEVIVIEDETRYRIRVHGFETNAAIAIEGLSVYDVTNVVSDAAGCLSFFLPNGDHAFTIADWDFAATVADAPTNAAASVGFMVNGDDIGMGTADGWSFYFLSGQLVLDGSVPYALSGTNDTGRIRVRCVSAADVDAFDVTFTNVWLDARDAAVAGDVLSGTPFALTGAVTLTLAGANTLVAGSSSAALYVPSGASVTILGDGSLAAEGGSTGAAIGGAYQEAVGSITLSGGIVTATAGADAACVGGGGGSCGGSVTITDGTLYLSGSRQLGTGIGATFDTGVTIIGGAVYADETNVRPAATDADFTAVHPVDIAIGDPLSPVELDLSTNYGADSLYTDASGILRIWLPDGSYDLYIDGIHYLADVAGTPTNAVPYAERFPTGVFVNGVEAAHGRGTGWRYDEASSNLVLAAAGPYLLFGTNALGRIRVVCAPSANAEQTVALSNLVLSVDSASAPLGVATGATVRLLLAGSNRLDNRGAALDESAPAIAVPATATLRIASVANVPGGILEACGGYGSAAIGGGEDTGTIAIEGGEIHAMGGIHGAGIGGGNQGAGGAIEISGGFIEATSGDHSEAGGAAAIGGGYGDSATAPFYRQTGGTVVARGSNVGIGGQAAAAAETLVTGGSLHLDGACTTTVAPSNGTARVWCVTITNLPPNETVKDLSIVVTNQMPYGTADLVADGAGRLYLWLPDGSYSITRATGDEWHGDVAGAGIVLRYGPLAAQPDSLHIDSIEVTDAAVVLVVSALPADWLTDNADNLGVRAASDLPLPAGGGVLLPGVTATVNGDGTATLTIPRTSAPRLFLQVESGY